MMKNAEYSDNHIDVSKTEKRIVRISSKNYEHILTGTYISLKLFKHAIKEGEFQFSQSVTVSLDEFQAIIDRLPKIKRMLGNKLKLKKLLQSRKSPTHLLKSEKLKKTLTQLPK